MTTQPPLRDAVEEYLRLRRALGFKLDSTGRLLGQFVDYLAERGVETISIDDALAWASLPARASTQWRAIRLRAVRGFAAYLHGIDASVMVPPAGLIRSGSCRATPYLYSAIEIASLLEATGHLRPRLRAVTYYHLIGLLAVSGMRIGEAIALNDDDLDTEQDLLIVRHAKFDKVRLVPLHPTTTTALSGYRQRRDELCPRRSSPSLFVSSVGTRLLHSNIGLTFAGFTRRSGISARSASCRPRVHDLRH